MDTRFEGKCKLDLEKMTLYEVNEVLKEKIRMPFFANELLENFFQESYFELLAGYAQHPELLTNIQNIKADFEHLDQNSRVFMAEHHIEDSLDSLKLTPLEVIKLTPYCSALKQLGAYHG